MVMRVRIPQNAAGEAPGRPPGARAGGHGGAGAAPPSATAAVMAALPLVAPAALAVLLSAAPAAAAVTHLSVPVRGMTCALCTRGVEESIRSLGGLNARAELAAGRVQVEAAGKSLVVRDVKERILSAGFGIGGEVQASAIGRFVIGADRRITFKVSNTAYVFQVLEGEQLHRMFKQSPGLGGEFLVHFRLHDHPRWNPPAIAITGFERRSPAPGPAAR